MSSADRAPYDVAGFNAELARLRVTAGAPSYRTLSRRTGLARSTVHDALNRPTLPSLDLTVALVRALGGDVDEWRDRWTDARAAEDGSPADPRDDILPVTVVADELEVVEPAVVEPAVVEPAVVEPTVVAPQPVADNARESWLRRHRVLVTAAAVVVLAGGAGGVVLASRGSSGCTHASVYRVSAPGRVLDKGSGEIARVVAGDLVEVRSTDHDAFPHRYAATVISTGERGYVDEAKLTFVRDSCVRTG